MISSVGDAALTLQKWKRCSAQLPVTSSSCLVQVSWTETRLTPTVMPKQATSPSVLSSQTMGTKSPTLYRPRAAECEFYGGSAGGTNGTSLITRLIVRLFVLLTSLKCVSVVTARVNATQVHPSALRKRLESSFERRTSKDFWVPWTQLI
ncbi:hypothetical protein ABVT39_000322 [Epinephelus coioides]